MPSVRKGGRSRPTLPRHGAGNGPMVGLEDIDHSRGVWTDAYEFRRKSDGAVAAVTLCTVVLTANQGCRIKLGADPLLPHRTAGDAVGLSCERHLRRGGFRPDRRQCAVLCQRCSITGMARPPRRRLLPEQSWCGCYYHGTMPRGRVRLFNAMSATTR